MKDENLATELLAASIHEIKNRFGLLYTELDELTSQLAISDASQIKAQRVKSEAQFISSELVRVLTSYKSLTDDFSLNIDQQFAEEFLEEVIARHGFTCNAHNLTLTMSCEEDVTGFFDKQVLTILLDTCIYNSVKAGADKINLTASEDDSYFYLCIDDNGPGFPADMLEGEISQGELQLDKQSTGLGLFFANKLIQQHKEGESHGKMTLSKSETLDGAKVILQIPH